jgi:hypothetical protein
LGLAACGQGASNNSASSFDTQFNASFDKSTHDSCYSAATGKGAAADLAEKYCTCLVQQADKLTTQEKLALPTHTDQMNQMATTCNAQVQAGQAAAPASNAAP